MKFKEINIPHLLFILVMKYSKFIYEFLYKNLTMVKKKKKTDKFRVKMQNLSNPKTFATSNIYITKKKKIILNILKYTLIKILK